MSHARLARLTAALLLVGVTASCAYYNTFYLARKYYMKATDGQPYEVDRDGTTQRTNYTKSADYAKKLLGVYPKSKYVDDAWLIWARTLIGADDPLKAVTMLQEFETRFPKSPLRPDAEFFLGLAYRAARKHEQALAAFDEFLVQAPKHPLVPYAFYERSKALMSLQRYRDASESAGQILDHFPKHVIFDRALRQRAEARFQQEDWVGARSDFHSIGDRALTDDERQRYLLREVDCLESSRNYDDARALLRDARSHLPPLTPLSVLPRAGTAGNPNSQGSAFGNNPTTQPGVARTPAEEQYGRLTLRMGGVELLAGHVDLAVEAYRSVFKEFPRSQLSAEAQYLIGYAYETGADDFQRARTEYALVREQAGLTQFAQQAQQRLENLDRIDRFRTAGGQDSLARKAEGRFLVAEHYLFNLQRPERALEEYQAIFDSSSIPSVRARALNAQAWLLARKLSRKTTADSLFWKVVHEYPATEAQIAARDYLEAEGQLVPETLIVAPKEFAKPLLDIAEPLTQPPGTTPRLGTRTGPGGIDPGVAEYGPGLTPPVPNYSMPAQWRGGALTDSLRQVFAMRDSLIRIARSDTSAAGRVRVDSLRRAMARSDTLGRGALMARIADEVPRADSVVVAPDSVGAPNLSAVDTLATTPASLVVPTARAPLPSAPRLGPPPARPRATADSLLRAARAAADTTKGVVRRDSTHTSVLSPKRVFTAADTKQRAARAAATADSVKRAAAATDSVRAATAATDDVRRAEAAADSARRVASAAAETARRAALAAADSSRLAARADSARWAAANAKPPKPVLPDNGSIVSWDHPPKGPHLTTAQRDSARLEERARKEAKRDSLKRVAATRDSLKRAAKAAKAARVNPSPGVPDSARNHLP